MGKHHTNETRKKISEKNKGLIPHNKYKIIHYDINMIFIKEWESAYDVWITLGISQSNISGVINNKRKTAGGFIWLKKL